MTPDTVAFESAIRPVLDDLLAYFVRRTVPRDEAADCLSETLVVLWRRRHVLPSDHDQVRAWAFGIAKGVLANHRRGKLRRMALADRVRAQVSSSATVDAEAAAESADLLSHLSTTDAELVRLIVWDGFGVAEAGALLGLRAGAARMRFSRAKASLRAAMVMAD